MSGTYGNFLFVLYILKYHHVDKKCHQDMASQFNILNKIINARSQRKLWLKLDLMVPAFIFFKPGTRKYGIFIPCARHRIQGSTCSTTPGRFMLPRASHWTPPPPKQARGLIPCCNNYSLQSTNAPCCLPQIQCNSWLTVDFNHN